MRYHVTIDSPAPDADVLAMLDAADRHSSFVDDYANPVPLQRTVHFVRKEP
jgi:hypothetical protein